MDIRAMRRRIRKEVIHRATQIKDAVDGKVLPATEDVEWLVRCWNTPEVSSPRERVAIGRAMSAVVECCHFRETEHRNQNDYWRLPYAWSAYCRSYCRSNDA